MSKEKWYALSEKERLIWDQLDDKAKSIILGIGNNGPPTTASIQDKTSDLNTETKANLHGMSAYDFIQANLHDLGPENGEKEIAPETDDSVNPNEANRIKADKSSTSKLPPGDIRRVLSKSSTRSANMVTIVYNTSALNASGFNDLSLVDRGANGGIAGDDVRVMFKNDHTVNICGIDKHQIADIEIGTVGGVVETHKGPVIAVMHQYALLGKGPSIHSPGQIEHFKNQVDDKSINVGGSQTITTFDGYVIPLTVKDGLVWLKMRPFTDEEYGSLPHVILTDERSWDPSVLDNEVFDKEKWFDWYSKNQATFGSEYLEATPHDKLIGNTSVKSMHYWKEHSVNIVDTEESSIISNKRGVTTFVKE
jgi:hypothetical protein